MVTWRLDADMIDSVVVSRGLHTMLMWRLSLMVLPSRAFMSSRCTKAPFRRRQTLDTRRQMRYVVHTWYDRKEVDGAVGGSEKSFQKGC